MSTSASVRAAKFMAGALTGLFAGYFFIKQNLINPLIPIMCNAQIPQNSVCQALTIAVEFLLGLSAIIFGTLCSMINDNQEEPYQSGYNPY